MSLPQTMKAVVFSEPGSADVLKIEEIPVPALRPGEILIEVHAAGVNRPDIAQRLGKYPPPADASPRLGLEVSGRVVQTTEGSRHRIGDAVCALAPGGGYAEYCVVPDAHALPIPAGYSFENAAGIPETYFTVWANVFQIGRLQAGESLLVHGGTSGIGTTAIQLARAFGARAYATAGSDEKCAACVKLGAEKAVNYKTQDFVAELKTTPPNVILDMVAGTYTPRNLDLIAPFGRIVQISVQKGAEVTINLSKLMQKRVVLTGSTLRPRTIEDKAQIASELHEKVWPILESKRAAVLVDRVYPLNEVADAHRYLEKSEHIGKVILKVR